MEYVAIAYELIATFMKCNGNLKKNCNIYIHVVYQIYYNMIIVPIIFLCQRRSCVSILMPGMLNTGHKYTGWGPITIYTCQRALYTTSEQTACTYDCSHLGVLPLPDLRKTTWLCWEAQYIPSTMAFANHDIIQAKLLQYHTIIRS